MSISPRLAFSIWAENNNVTARQIQPLYIDLETYSDIPIAYGSHRYAERAEILLFAFARGDAPVEVRDITNGEAIPDELYDKRVPIIVHNSAFDRTIVRHVLRYDIPIKRMHDTMAQARTLGLPGSLDVLSKIMYVPPEKMKDKKGKDLIHLFCKPRPENNLIRRATRETHPQEWTQFIEYARLDIEAMRAIYNKFTTWNYRDRELALWQLDQKINDRGVCVDTHLAESALRAIGDTKRALDESTSETTLGCVESATKRDQLLRFILRAYGITLPDMQAATIERRLEDPEVPTELKELLAIRLQTCTTSTAKYKALLNSVSSDGRLRGILEFCGAGRTGRWAGRKFQVHNLPARNLMPQADIDRGIDLLKIDSAPLVYDNVMKLISSCIRGAVIASPGKKLVVSDLANIEGRAAVWVAGEKWKLKAFEDFDKGIGFDLYVLSYARAFDVDPATVTKHQRQIGKVMELMLQYEGGVGAFLTGAATYDIDLDEMADAAWSSIPPGILKEAQRAWVWAKEKNKTFELAEKTYIVCDALKRMWRLAHPAISSCWRELDAAFRTSILSPGKIIACRRLTMLRQGSWIRVMLPSGRSLCYAAPLIRQDQITYMGMHQLSRKWSRLTTYGGKIFENICQAIARDVMAWNLPAIEAADYEILFTVHDEVATEAPLGDAHTAAGLSGLLSTHPPWAKDMPLAAKGFEDTRYRKD